MSPHTWTLLWRRTSWTGHRLFSTIRSSAPLRKSPSTVGRLVVGGIKGLCAVHLFLTHVLQVHPTLGPSMLPTMPAGHNYILIDRTAKYTMNFRRGDIITMDSPRRTYRVVCKRIIGLPGDTIMIDPTAESPEWVVIPEGHIWVAGDNLALSMDSRTYGPVPMAMIRGRVLANLYPSLRWFERGPSP